MVKVEDEDLLNTSTPAFQVICTGGYKFFDPQKMVEVKTTIYTLRANNAFLKEHRRLKDEYQRAPFIPMEEKDKARADLRGFEMEACRLVCGEDAKFSKVPGGYVVTYTREA